jgi:hypothetical protein
VYRYRYRVHVSDYYSMLGHTNEFGAINLAYSTG